MAWQASPLGQSPGWVSRSSTAPRPALRPPSIHTSTPHRLSASARAVPEFLTRASRVQSPGLGTYLPGLRRGESQRPRDAESHPPKREREGEINKGLEIEKECVPAPRVLPHQANWPGSPWSVRMPESRSLDLRRVRRWETGVTGTEIMLFVKCNLKGENKQNPAGLSRYCSVFL